MMNIPMMDSYLESLDGYIRDEDKLVTYKWLSKELEVHVNIAKIILWHYWQKYKSNELVATLMLIGNLKSGGMRVEVVKDEDLIEAREKFEKIISEHIYSLQKSLLNIEILAGTDKGDSRYSAIKCENSVILSDEELSKIRWGKASIPQAAAIEKKVTDNVASKKESVRAEEAPKSDDQRSNEVKTKNEEKPVKKISPTNKHKVNEKKGAISKKPIQSTKTGFGNLFGKVANQQKTQPSSSSTNVNRKNVEKETDILIIEESAKINVDDTLAKEEVMKNGELNLRKNDDSKVNDKSSNLSKKNETENEKNSTSRNVTSSKNEKSSKNLEKSTTGQKSKGTKSKSNVRGKKRDRSRDSENETKKRKRIFVESDSSEDSAPPSDAEDMFESPKRPESSSIREKSPSPPLIKHDGNKRKVRKLVDKTFVDDDGFLITKKVHVYESCSEEETEITETTKAVEPDVPKETKFNVKKKQTTLTNFFKKA